MMLTAFQSDNLLMSFVCGELSSIVRVRIVKPDILDQATSPRHRLAESTRSLRTAFVCRNLTSVTLPVYWGVVSMKELLQEKEISEGGLASFSK